MAFGGFVTQRRVLTVVMDGVGIRDERFGNAVAFASTPHMQFLHEHGLYTTLRAHGTAVGMPSDADLGNSEVGHNALGAGRVFDQGAKLVQHAIDSGRLFTGTVWQQLIRQVVSHNSTLHLIGLLSDGNVHSHEQHLYALMRAAKAAGVKRIRIHPLIDGRDVGEKSAEIYVTRLNQVIDSLNDAACDVQVASGGGRMIVTMDRYEADWEIVHRGWQAHVLGKADLRFPSLAAAIAHFRTIPTLTDQYLPPFVITAKDGSAVGPIVDNDAVVFFNFRGDRAMEISRAFASQEFPYFDRVRVPKIFYAGMMEYDGDLKIPEHYLVSPPEIENTLGEYLARQGKRQFACSETQKFGHVTYFWNGNRTGKFADKLEEYVEITSDRLQFDLRPWMKAAEITDVTIERMHAGAFDAGRINYANGDMVGHTGNFLAAVIAVETVDLMLGRLIGAAQESDTILLITADHGNCDDMYDAKPSEFPGWTAPTYEIRPKPKTAHSLNPVPFYLYDPRGISGYALNAAARNPSLANVANTILTTMGMVPVPDYLPSLVIRK